MSENQLGLEIKVDANTDKALKSIEEAVTKAEKEVKGLFDDISSIGLKCFKGLFKGSVSLVKSSTSAVLGVYKSMFSTIGSLFDRIATRSADSFSSKMKTAFSNIAPYLSLYGLFTISKEALSLGGSMVELQNVVDSTFKNMSDDIDDFCNNALEKFGLTEKEAKNFTGVFGSILKSSGVAGDNMALMSKNLSALTGDIASFYNISRDDAFEKLKSGISGTSLDPLRALGINMTVANLEAYALSKGITTSYQSMNNASQAALRYNYILDQTRQLQGDFSKTCYSWSNQIRVLQGNFQTFLTLLGQGMVKVLYPFILALNKLMSYVNSTMSVLAEKFNFSQINLEDMFGTGGVQDISGVMEDNADSMNDFANSTKKAKGQLAGFDILNNLTTSDSSSKLPDLSNNIGFPLDSYIDNVKEPDTKKLEGVIDKIANKLSEYASNIANDVNYQPIKKAWSNLVSQTKPLINDFGKAIDWSWKNILFPFYKWSAEQGVPVCLDLFAEGLRSLHLVLNAVSPAIDKFWKETLAPFFKAQGEKFTKTVKGWTASLKEWNDGLEQSSDKIQYLKDTMENLWGSFKTKHPEMAKNLEDTYSHIKDLFEYVKSNKDSLKNAFSIFGDALGKIATKAIEQVVNWFNWLVQHSEQIASFFSMLVDEFSILSTNTTDFTQDIFAYLLDNKDTVQDILDNLNNVIKNIFDFISSHKEEILGAIKGISEVLEVCSEHIGLISTLLLGAKVVSEVSKWKRKFDDVRAILEVLGHNSKLGSLGKLKTMVSDLGTNGVSKIGALAEAFGGLSGVIGGIALPAGLVALMGYGTKTAWNSGKSSRENQKNFEAEYTKLAEKKYNDKSTLDYKDVIQNQDDYNNLLDTFSQGVINRAITGQENLNSSFTTTKSLLKDIQAFASTSSNENIEGIALSVDENSTRAEVYTAIRNIINEVNGETGQQKMIQMGMGVNDESVEQTKADLNTKTDEIIENTKAKLNDFGVSWSDYWTRFKADASANWSLITSEISTGASNLWSSISASFNNIRTSISTSISGAVSSIQTGWGSIVTTVTSRIDELVSAFTGISDKFRNVGSNIVNGLKQGISDKWTGTKDWFSDRCSSLVDKARNIFDIHSPSRVFAKIGAYCMAGLGIGFADESSATTSTFQNALSKVLGGVSNNDNVIKTTAKVLETNFCSALDSIGVKSESLGDKIKRTLGDIGVKGSADLAFNYNRFAPVTAQQGRYSNNSYQAKNIELIAQMISDLRSDNSVNRADNSNQKMDVHVYVGNEAIDNHIVKVVRRDDKNSGNF